MRLALISALGATLFLWPFAGAGVPPFAPALTLALAGLGALVLLEAGTRRLDTRALALLATIAAVDAGLRLAVVTGVGGFSPVFFLILCGGYVFGASFGFLCGSLALIVSALATGGVGPWLPYQLFAAGWVGVAAGMLPRPGGMVRVRHLLPLALVAAAAGFGFGLVMDTWDWTAFYRGAPDFGWTPGLAPLSAAARFMRFYVATSLAYDSLRAAGNVLLILLLGPPVINALVRVRARMSFEIV